MLFPVFFSRPYNFCFSSYRIEMLWNYMIRCQYHVLLCLTYQCSWKVCNESSRNLQKEENRGSRLRLFNAAQEN